MQSVFAKHHNLVYKHRWTVTLLVDELHGGIPSDPRVADGWLRTKLGTSADDLLRDQIAEVMLERGLEEPAAKEEVLARRHLNGFKTDGHGLYIEGRQVKAGIKEAANICWPKRKWGPSSKGTLGFWAEHVMVREDRLYLGINEASGVHQRFVHTWRGAGIQYEEIALDVKVTFTLECDSDAIENKDWATLWITGEQQGIGAARSQGFGRYRVIQWDKD